MKSLPPDIPPEAVSILKEMGYLEEDPLHVGDRAPLLTLRRLEDNAPVVLGAPDAVLPAVLIFGSYT